MNNSLTQWLTENFERSSQRYPKSGAYRSEYVTYKAKRSRTPRFKTEDSMSISIRRILVWTASLGSLATLMFFDLL
ncbi:MAG: hypothetical protein JNK57_05985 [Planctomycetaceae bacterium]|nr:hypothetical protein [Planctomycetaceae bacterium]